MKFIKLLGRFIPVFKWRILAYILLMIISSVFSVFSFIAIVPLLKVLFGLSDEAFTYIDPSTITSWSGAMDTMKNNVMFYLQGQINLYGPGRALIIIGGFIVLMSLLSNVVSYFAYWVRIPIRTGVSRDLRRDVYSTITQMKLDAFSDENRGDFVSRMTNDVEEIEYGIASTLDMLIMDPVKIVVFIIAMFGVSAKMTWLSLMLSIIGAAIVFLVGKHMTTISLKAQALRGKILSVFGQTLGGLQIVKSFNLEKRLETSFSVINEETRKVFNSQNRFYSIAWPGMDFFLTIVITIILCVGGVQIFENESLLEASELIGFLVIFYSMIAPMRDMIKCTYGIRKAIASAERVDYVNAVPREFYSGSNLESLSESEPVLKYQDVNLSYDGQEILHDINVTVNKGEKVAVIGNTGAGKSTLAKLALRFMDPDSGEVSFFGQNVKRLDLVLLRKSIGYISQEAYLFNDTIFNNISFADENATEEDVKHAAKIAGIHDFIMSLPDAYDTVIGDCGFKLSGGQKQCICIARAILKNAPVLIMDEATSSVDSETETKISRALDDIMNNRTVLIVSHHPREILRVDKVYVLKDGAIVESGTPESLLSEDSYLSRMVKFWNK